MEGQINLGSPSGDKIKEITELDTVSTVVEIGTWNGRGTTRCVMEGMKGKESSEFYTLECNKKEYEIAKSADPGDGRTHFLLGRIVEEEDLDETELLDEGWFNESAWLEQDKVAMREVPNVLDMVPEEIDFLILDGGEFSTRKELQLLKDRSKYIFLDDTVVRKNKANRIDLMLSDEFQMLEDHQNDRNGWSLFVRKQENELLQLNNLAALHDGKHILFCKTDYLDECLPYLHANPRPCVLITGNSDYSITDDIAAAAPDCIVRWFAQNADTTNPKVEGIPIGIENSEECKLPGHGVGWPHAIPKVEALLNYEDREPTKEVYANFSLDTHHSRAAVYDSCKNLGHVTTTVSKTHFEINIRSYENYVNDILDHKMVVCPRGNGVDCHRVWEVLHLNRVPIIKRENAMRYFEDLPIIMLDDWSELQSLETLHQKYDAVKDNSREALNIDYWMEIIKNAIEPRYD